MLIVGVTGNFGTGKTTVCEIMAELGASVISADDLGHRLRQRDSPAYQKLVATFGESILSEQKEIDRSKLSALAFKDDASESSLNKIMHPLILKNVRQRIEELKRKGVKIVVVEAALLIEAGWKSLVDQVWVTTAPESVIIERLGNQRGYTREQVLARLRNQMPPAEKVKYADVVIDTDRSLPELKAVVNELWKKMPLSVTEDRK
jgi:dephospho-CoA kinase